MEKITIEPEFLYTEMSTSDGLQIKYYKDGYWYKVDHFGGEGLAEYLSSLALKNSNLAETEYVSYKQIMINDEPGCVSRNCLSEGEELVSFYRFWANIKGGDIASFLQKMDYDDAIETTLGFMKEQTGLDLHRYLANNLAFSAFIRNEDLHFNNLWVILNGDSYREAPILDCGKSMFVGNDKYRSDLPMEENMKQSFAKAFSGNFDLNYRYLSAYCTLRIDKNRLLSDLEKEPASKQRDFLIYQCTLNEKLNDLFS